MLAAPLLFWITLSGCPPGECVGAGCQEVYSAAMVSVFQGDQDGLGARLDPAEDAWLSMTGSEALGPDWGVALAGNTMVLGAPSLGAVLIFHLDGREAGSLGGQALVIPDIVDQQGDSRLGAALLLADLDGDGQRELVASAPAGPGEDDAVSAGRVYLFDTDGYFSHPLHDTGGAAPLDASDARFTALGAMAYDQAGTVLARCGDLDGDGIVELAVAARWSEEGGAALGGAVHVLSSRAIREALQTGERRGSLAALGASYASSQLGATAGAALDCSADLDGDSLPELLVGAPYADHGEDDAAGAVYILSGARILAELDSGVVSDLDTAASARLVGPSAEAYLGSSLSVGDVGRDGAPDLLVGVPGGGRERGLALLYADLDIDRDEPEPTLRFIGENAGDRFGSAVGLPDLNGDRYDDIVVGAPRHNPTGRDEHFAAGAVYAWYGEQFFRAWSESSDAQKADTIIARQQAWLLTGARIDSEDLDGDGLDELVLVHRIQPDF